MTLSPRARTTLRWTGIGLGVGVAAILLTLALVDWNSLKGPIERFATAKSGRTVRIAGNLDVDVWTWTPKVTVEGLTLGNPPWEPAKPMAQIEKLHVQLALLPLLKGDIVSAARRAHQAQRGITSRHPGPRELDLRKQTPDERTGKPATGPASRAGIPHSGRAHFPFATRSCTSR